MHTVVPKQSSSKVTTDSTGTRTEALRFLEQAIVHANALAGHDALNARASSDRDVIHRVGLMRALQLAYAAVETSIAHEVT